MDVAAALLCDSATVREGLLNVLGAGVTRLWRPELPAPLAVTLAVIAEMAEEDLPVPHEVEVTISNTGGLIGQAMGGFQAGAPAANVEAGERFLVPIALDLRNAGTNAYGRHEMRVSIDAGAAERTLLFWVLHPDELRLPAIHLPG